MPRHDGFVGVTHDGFHSIDEGLNMTAKKRSASAKKELKATVKDLRSKLDRADAKAERLKSKAAGLKNARKELEAQVKELRKRNTRLEKASRPAEPRKPDVTEETSMVTDGPGSAVPPATADPSPTAAPSSVEPDAGWTVVQLRAEARSRGLTGMSGKTKAQLLAALR